jgi:hypothetical protein
VPVILHEMSNSEIKFSYKKILKISVAFITEVIIKQQKLKKRKHRVDDIYIDFN